jgi:ribosomal protein L19
MNGKIHFKDWDVYLAWNDGKPFQHLKRQSPGDEIKKIKALCGNVMKNDTNNFLGYIISNDKW